MDAIALTSLLSASRENLRLWWLKNLPSHKTFLGMRSGTRILAAKLGLVYDQKKKRKRWINIEISCGQCKKKSTLYRGALCRVRMVYVSPNPQKNKPKKPIRTSVFFILKIKKERKSEWLCLIFALFSKTSLKAKGW